MRSCFLPNCDANSRDWPTRPMFIAPKNPELFAKWKEVLPKKRIFKARDKVCLRHFEQTDLITTYDTVVEGTVVKIPRGRPKLKDNSIPCKFLTDCDYPKRGRKYGQKSNNTIKNEQPKKIQLKRVKIKKPLTAKSLYNQINLQPSLKSDEENISSSEDENVITSTENTLMEEIFENNCNNSSNETNEEIEIINIDILEEAFNIIFEDIFEVELPSTLWGIHRDPLCKFIAISYFDSDVYLTSKTIILNNTFKADILIFDKYLEKSLNEFHSIDDITDIVKRIHETKICKLAKQQNSLCELIANEKHNFCKMCLKHQV